MKVNYLTLKLPRDIMKFRNSKWRNLVILAVSFFVLILFAEVIPRSGDIIVNISEWITQSNKIGNLKETENKLGILTIKNNKLKSQINSIVSDYDEYRNISSVLNELNTIVAENNVKLINIHPESIVKKNNLWLQPMEINVESGYNELYNFVRTLEFSNKVIVVKDIHIIPGKMQSSNLKSTIRIEVYLNL